MWQSTHTRTITKSINKCMKYHIRNTVLMIFMYEPLFLPCIISNLFSIKKRQLLFSSKCKLVCTYVRVKWTGEANITYYMSRFQSNPNTFLVFHYKLFCLGTMIIFAFHSIRFSANKFFFLSASAQHQHSASLYFFQLSKLVEVFTHIISPACYIKMHRQYRKPFWISIFSLQTCTGT